MCVRLLRVSTAKPKGSGLSVSGVHHQRVRVLLAVCRCLSLSLSVSGPCLCVGWLFRPAHRTVSGVVWCVRWYSGVLGAR